MTETAPKFSRSTFAKLSPHPFLLANLAASTDGTVSPSPSRTNGRAPPDARPVHVNTSSLSHAHGSAVVRTGDTTVICGVRGEILPVLNIPNYRTRDVYDEDAEDQKRAYEREEQEIRDYDLLVPNIELATGCAPQFLPGVPPTPLAQTLSTRLYSLLVRSGLVSVRDLRIWKDVNADFLVAEEAGRKDNEQDMQMDDAEEEKKDATESLGKMGAEVVAYWVLFIDLLFISFDGNPFDVAWAATLAALRDTRLPFARWDADREGVVFSRKAAPRALTIRGFPIACSAAVFMEKEHSEGRPGEERHWLLVDPDRLEESLCREAATVVVDCVGGDVRIRSLEKHGGTVMGRNMIKELVRIAEGRWGVFYTAIVR